MSQSPITHVNYAGKKYMKLNVQIKQLLRQLPSDEARIEVMRAAIEEPLKWFCPNGKQEELVLTVADRMSKRRTPAILFSAANGVGKTEISINLLANVIYGVQNAWFLYKEIMYWRNPKVCWYITTKTGLTDTVIPAMRKYFPKDTYSFDKMGSALDRAIHFQNGWELRFFTMDVDPQQMESASVGLVIIDEPAPEAIWKACKSRGRGGQLTLLPMTPLDVEPYILDEIEKNKATDLYARVTASVYDACEERGVRGHLEAQIIDEMVSKYPADEKAARVDGEFMYFREKIWSNLDIDRHHVDPCDYPVDFKSDYFMHVVDPHDSRPSASFYMCLQLIEHSIEYKQKIAEGKASQQVRRIIFAETPTDHDNYYWEMYRDPAVKLEDEPAMWAELEDQIGLLVVHKRVIDKRFAFQTRLNSNIASIYSKAGRELDQNFHGSKRFVYSPSYDIRSTDANSEISYGHNAVMSAMDDLEDGKPGLVVWRTCVHTCNGMTHYLRKRLNRASDSNIAVGDSKIIEKYKDFNDLLRYGVCEKLSQSYMENRRQDKEDRNVNHVPYHRDNGTNKSIIKSLHGHLRKVR